MGNNRIDVDRVTIEVAMATQLTIPRVLNEGKNIRTFVAFLNCVRHCVRHIALFVCTGILLRKVLSNEI